MSNENNRKKENVDLCDFPFYAFDMQEQYMIALSFLKFISLEFSGIV